jgi:hypothetical protein
MMAKTIKATEPPMTTIMMGSRSVVRAADAVLDLLVVAFGDVLQHVFELTGALPDGDHVGDDGGELFGALEGSGDALALADVLARLLDDINEAFDCPRYSSRCPSP